MKLPQSIKSICAYCGVGCGLEVTRNNEKELVLRGDAEHPANKGALCVKGSHLLSTTALDGRIGQPQISGRLSNWHESISMVAQRFNEYIQKYGKESIAFYVSGQLLTEDYYVANKLMKGFIGSANIDTNSRLCMSSAVMAHKRAFGSDSVPGCYDDIDLADCWVVAGSNMAWTHPIVFRRIENQKKLNSGKILIVIDPRETATSKVADIHLKIKPGTDSYLFNGLLVYLFLKNAIDKTFINNHCNGFEEALEVAKTSAPSMDAVASICDLNIGKVRQFYEVFSKNKKVVSIFSQGINQSNTGADKGNAIINCHLATGKIGKEGATPFSITGQPNAMGGREVGGLATQLTTHLDLENKAHRYSVQSFWDSPHCADKKGKTAVELFQAIENGEIKALWIMGTNPAFSLPNQKQVQRALKQCEFVVVSECFDNKDTLPFADVVFPASAWGEKEGMVTNSERCISKQNPMFKPFMCSQPDWWIISNVAQAMGFKSAFDYDSAFQVYKEFILLTEVNRNKKWGLNLSGLQNLTKQEYKKFSPKQWPIVDEHSYGTKRLFCDGDFHHADGKARLIPVFSKLPDLDSHLSTGFVLNTGRIRDQWHSMTRTGRSVDLMSHQPVPKIFIHPEDAKLMQIKSDGFVEVFNKGSRIILKSELTKQQRRKEVFVPIHWSKNYCNSTLINELTSPVLDPISQQPQFKQSSVRLRALEPYCVGRVFLRNESNADADSYSDSDISTNAKDSKPDIKRLLSYFDYVCRVPFTQGDVFEFASFKSTESIFSNALESECPIYWQWIRLKDSNGEFSRALAFDDRKLMCWLEIYWSSHSISSLDTDVRWIQSCFESKHLADNIISDLVVGRKIQCNSTIDRTPIICSCFQVTEQTIIKAVESGHQSVEDIQKYLKAGTNCGSCLLEIGAIIEDMQAIPA